MGNELSSMEVAEDPEANIPESDSEVESDLENGPITVQSSSGVYSMPQKDQVDGKQTVQQENVITSSQKTIVISPLSNGVETKPPVPAAKSKFRLTISRPAPGRTTFQANGPTVESVEPQMVPQDATMIQDQRDNPIILETVTAKQSAGGNLNQAPPATEELRPVEVEVEATPSKPKEISIFQRLFKPEKKVQIDVPVQNQQEESQEAALIMEQTPTVQCSNSQIKNIDDCKQAAVQVQISDTAGHPAQECKETQTSTEETQTSPTAEVHPVMSFFKTLVSPNKSVVKSEEEPKSEVDKSKKDELQQNVKQVVEEQAVVAVAVNSEKAAPEQILTQDTKTSESNVQPQISEQKDEAKAAKESTPRIKPFWRKSFKGETQPSKIEENSLKEEPQVIILTDNASAEPQPQIAETKVVAPGNKALENQEKAKKPEEGKNANTKPKLMMFFKQLSVIGDGGNANSEEVNEKSTNQPTLDITDGADASKTDKTVVTAMVEAPVPAPKSKENPKEKKGATEKNIKQESREIAEPVILAQQQLSDPSLVQNGSDANRDIQLKRTEKRQSLGSFFKAIGPRRMCDAEVQTDPVSIYPTDKLK